MSFFLWRLNSQAASNLVPLSARQQNAIWMAFAGGSIVARFYVLSGFVLANRTDPGELPLWWSNIKSFYLSDSSRKNKSYCRAGGHA